MSDNVNENVELDIDIHAIVDAIDEKKASEFYKENSAEAEEILKDEAKMEELIEKVDEVYKTVPASETALSYIPLMMSLVKDHVKKEYTKTSQASMVSVVVALMYFVSPLDLIPDTIPMAGYVDDAVVISGCLALIRDEIEEYIAWSKDNGQDFGDIPDYDEIIKESKEHDKLAKAFFKGKKSAGKK